MSSGSWKQKKHCKAGLGSRSKLALFALAALLATSLSSSALAGAFEFSFGFSYNHTQYSEDSYNWTRKWGSSFGYNFNDRSELEVSFQDVLDRTSITDFEDTTIHDRIYGINWVQSLLGRDFPVQPYVKVGIGQLNRDAQGNYANGVSPPAEVDSVTGILGGGLRLYFTRQFAIRTEATSYLVGGSIRTWKDNLSATFGVSVYF